MNLKSILSLVAILLAGPTTNAATFSVSNIGDLLNDRLYAYEDNTRMNTTTGGIVTIGYFTAGVTASNINTVQGLYANLANFTVMSSSAPGALMPNVGTGLSIDGYADNTHIAAGTTGQLLSGNALIGRIVYSIVTNAAGLGVGDTTAMFNANTLQLGLVSITTLAEEPSGELSYSSNPTLVPLVGSLGTFNGDVGFGNGTYSTFRMETIPEPSTLLLTTLGLFALMRRRR